MIREQRMRVEHHAVLALGSNLGDREATMRAGIHDIAAVPGVVITGASSLVETAALKPEGVVEDAPAYLNAVVTIRTALDPYDLLLAMHAIERDHGRVRDVRWGDRTLDIDVIEFGGLMIASEDLTVPHPRAAERAFVLAPWVELQPNASLPGLGRIDALLAATGETPRLYPAEPLL